MKRLAALLVLGCISCGPVPLQAIELVDGKPVLDAEDKQTLAACKPGECAVWSRAEIVYLLAMYRQKLKDDGSMCRRNDV